MKLEDQVCSLELAKRLKELGVERESHFVWIQTSPDGNGWELELSSLAAKRSFYIGNGFCSAFTVAELGEMLPPHVMSKRINSDGWYCYMENTKGKGTGILGDQCRTEADARAKILIYLGESMKELRG